MPQFNKNKPYRLMKRTTMGVETFEVHQPHPQTPPGGGPPMQVYEPVTENPGNTPVVRPTLSAIQAFVLNKKSEDDGLVVVFDSEA